MFTIQFDIQTVLTSQFLPYQVTCCTIIMAPQLEFVHFLIKRKHSKNTTFGDWLVLCSEVDWEEGLTQMGH
jgi:hypothetical protein